MWNVWQIIESYKYFLPVKLPWQLFWGSLNIFVILSYITTMLMDDYFFCLPAHFSNHIIEGKRVHMPSVPDLLNRSPGYHQTGVGSPFSPGAHAPPSPGYLNSPVGCPQTSLGMDHSFPPPPAMFSPSSPFRKGKSSNRAGKSFVISVETCFAHVEKNNIVWRIKSASVFLGRFKDRFLLLYLFMKWKVQMTYYIYILLLKILNCHDLA